MLVKYVLSDGISQVFLPFRFVDIIVITVHDRFWNVGQANCILKYFENIQIPPFSRIWLILPGKYIQVLSISLKMADYFAFPLLLYIHREDRKRINLTEIIKMYSIN